MKSLPNLIRLHKSKLEEQRRRLNELETLKEQFGAQIQKVDADMAREARVAGESADAGHVLGGFVQSALHRRRRFEESAVEIEREIEAFKEQVAEAFRELKRFELAGEQKHRRERIAARRRERRGEDEIGIGIYRRRQERHGG